MGNRKQLLCGWGADYSEDGHNSENQNKDWHDCFIIRQKQIKKISLNMDSLHLFF